MYYSASRAEDSLMAALWSHYSGLVAVRGRGGYILESTLRLRYSSQYEMGGQISQSGGNSGAIAADVCWLLLLLLLLLLCWQRHMV